MLLVLEILVLLVVVILVIALDDGVGGSGVVELSLPCWCVFILFIIWHLCEVLLQETLFSFVRCCY